MKEKNLILFFFFDKKNLILFGVLNKLDISFIHLMSQELFSTSNSTLPALFFLFILLLFLPHIEVSLLFTKRKKSLYFVKYLLMSQESRVFEYILILM